MSLLCATVGVQVSSLLQASHAKDQSVNGDAQAPPGTDRDSSIHQDSVSGRRKVIAAALQACKESKKWREALDLLKQVVTVEYLPLMRPVYVCTI